MKRLFVLLALAFSFASLANDQKVKVSFTHFGHNAGSVTYYSCSYVESRAEMWLAKFGATDVEVYCRGGLETWGSTPVSVTASFNLPVLSGREIAEVMKIKGDAFNSACGLNTQMINEFIKPFKNITVLKKDDSCAFSTSNYYYELSIVR